MTSEKFVAYLRDRMERLELSHEEVATRANISRHTWHRLLNREVVETKFSTFIHLSKALQTHVVVLLELYCPHRGVSANLSEKRAKINYACGFVNDVTYPQNSLVKINQRFTKTWQLMNLGTRDWEAIYLACINMETQPTHCYNETHSPPMTTTMPIADTKTKQTVDISVQIVAPNFPCVLISEWKIVDKEGNLFCKNFSSLHCVVRVA